MKVFLSVILFLFSILSRAQEEFPEMVTDRPDQTESSSVVPLKTLQIETGFIFESDNSNSMKENSFNFNTTLLRFGLLERMELRLGFAYLAVQENVNTDSVQTNKGFAPLYTGFKILITEENGCIPEIAFLGGLVLPFAAKTEFKAPHAAPVMRFAFSHTLSEKFGLGYNLGAEWYGETAVPDYYYSVALGYSITPKIGTFIESFGLIPEEGKARHLADAGFTFLVLHNLQLDVSGGLGLNKIASDGFISFGLSYRIPD